EATGGDVGGGDRDRADLAEAVGLAGERLQGRLRPFGLGRLEADDLELAVAGGHPGRGLAEVGAAAAAGRELLVGTEVVDEAELDVGHRGAGGDGDAEAVRGDRAAGVERAVDRVDHDPNLSPLAEGHLAALL